MGDDQGRARDLIKSLVPKLLNEEDCSHIGKHLSKEEVEQAITSLSNDKSPGLDGLLVEFYKANLNWISEELLDLYEEAIDRGSLGKEINQELIKMIPKEGNKTLIRNWRPNTLLNVSYKSLAKAATNRLEKILHKIISPTQTGFVKGSSLCSKRIIHSSLWKELRVITINKKEVKMVSKRNWTDMFKVQPSTSINQGKSRSSLNRGGQELRNPEPKARWNPKKEQIEILESIYTSGKIRPSRDDIRMIRIQLLEFGEVEEANIFYWFQNRKSKNRKRQRLLVAGTANPIQTSTANPIQTMEKSSFPSLSPSISSFPNHQTQRVSADTHINLQQGGLSSGSTTYPYKYNSAISSFPQNYSSFLLPEKQSDPFNHYQRPEAAIPSALTDTNPDTRVSSTRVGSGNEDLFTVMIDGTKYKAPRGTCKCEECLQSKCDYGGYRLSTHSHK
ncbi:uncharacterized protein LOC131049476 [Cryptomeria japonica]|uniref:uncharacterized protein LOC131049476 n=1 Tax=Cryptomeria japonica TaxID=3369 RepID=UPI0027DA9BD7|nr:uncharacterized protein LOC131049476 [Cryptomeria japonica]